MSLKSMTGFASCSQSSETFGWRWEIRSVNGRGLDVRFRLGKRDELEQKLREKIAKKIQRGSVQVSLHIEREKNDTEILINEDALNEVIKAARLISEKIDTQAPSADGLLALPGVMSEVRLEETEEDASQRNQALLGSFDELLAELDSMRANEGAQIETIIREQFDQIKTLSGMARDDSSRSPEAISEKLSQQIATLLDNAQGNLPKDRLYTEATLIAVKADIKEEIDRIDAHISSGLDLLDKDGPVGRKLDFLVQELAREANTLCAKAGDPSLTKTGLTLKTVIDQMREQIQNLE